MPALCSFHNKQNKSTASCKGIRIFGGTEKVNHKHYEMLIQSFICFSTFFF